MLFAIKYRRRHEDEVGVAIHGSLALELLWTVIPFLITMVMFVWGAKVFFDIYRPPAGAMEIYVVGKQWMWKAQHMDGAARDQRAARAGRPPGQADHGVGGRDPQLLHPGVPREGRRVPGPLQHLWFTATKPGTLSPVLRRVLRHQALRDDRLGLRDGAGRVPGLARRRQRARDSPAAAGEKLFQDSRLHHAAIATTRRRRGPQLKGLFGKHRAAAGRRAPSIADEAYIRESILNPQAKIVAASSRSCRRSRDW